MSMSKKKTTKKEDETKAEPETKGSKLKTEGKDAGNDSKETKSIKSGDSKAGDSKSPKTTKKKGDKDKEEASKKKKDSDEKDADSSDDKEEKDKDKDSKDKDAKDKDAGKKKPAKGKKEDEPKKDDKKSASKSREDDKVKKDPKGKGKKEVDSEEEEEPKEEVEEAVVEQKPYDADSSVYVQREGGIFAHEKRTVKVNDDKTVVIKDLPSSFVPSSLLFRSLSDPAASLSEQTFFDGSQSLSHLLAESRGKVVALRLHKTSDSLRGKIVEVAADDVTVLREDEDAVVVIPKSSIALVEASNSVVDVSPTLRGVIETETLGEHKAEITYSAEGITWTADYSLLLLSKTEAEVAGWYTVNNTSGKAFHNAAFTLVAEVSGYAPARKQKGKLFGSMVAKVVSPRGESEGSSSSRGFTKEQVKYHLPRPLTIGGHEAKQVRLVSSKVPILTVNFFNGCPHRYAKGTCWPGAANAVSKNLQLVARFDNNKETHASLGVVFPAGSLDVYQRTHQDTFIDLVYQHHIERSQPGETINFPIGPENQQLTAERKSLDYKSDSKRRVISETVQIEVRNKTGKSQDVLVEESLYRWKDYQVSGAVPKPTWAQKGSHTLLWQIAVKADTTAVIKYQVVYNGVPA